MKRFINQCSLSFEYSRIWSYKLIQTKILNRVHMIVLYQFDNSLNFLKKLYILFSDILFEFLLTLSYLKSRLLFCCCCTVKQSSSPPILPATLYQNEYWENISAQQITFDENNDQELPPSNRSSTYISSFDKENKNPDSSVLKISRNVEYLLKVCIKFSIICF